MRAPRFHTPFARLALRAFAPLLLVLLAAGFRAGDGDGDAGSGAGGDSFHVHASLSGHTDVALGGLVQATSHRPPAAVQGMAEYPGARRTQGHPDGDGADVSLRLPFMTMRMEAVRYTTSDPMDRVLRFYRRELATYGEVKLTQGGPNTHIEEFGWDSRPDQRTLTAEREDRVHIVALKPLATGCEFALMYLSFK